MTLKKLRKNNCGIIKDIRLRIRKESKEAQPDRSLIDIFANILDHKNDEEPCPVCGGV